MTIAPVRPVCRCTHDPLTYWSPSADARLCVSCGGTVSLRLPHRARNLTRVERVVLALHYRRLRRRTLDQFCGMVMDEATRLMHDIFSADVIEL